MTMQPLTTMPTRREVFDTLLIAAAVEFNVTTDELRGPSRERKYSEPRMLMYYILTTDLGWKNVDVGTMLHREHSTISNGKHVIAARVRNRDPETLYALTTLRKALAMQDGVTTRYEEIADMAASTVKLAVALRETIAAAGAVIDRMEAVALDAQRAYGEFTR